MNALLSKADRAQAAKEALQAIADSSGGYLKPAVVVEAAQDSGHPLHDYFVWDDSEAAAMFRLTQARLLIRSIKIDIVRPASAPKQIEIKPVRAFQSPPSIRWEGSYVSTQKAMGSDDLRAELLERAKRELIGLKTRYKDLNELARVWEAVSELEVQQ